MQRWGGRTYKVVLEVAARPQAGFQVVRRRWAVERTLAWVLNFCRLVKDYETHARNREALIQVAMIKLLSRRLA